MTVTTGAPEMYHMMKSQLTALAARGPKLSLAKPYTPPDSGLRVERLAKV